MRSKSARWSSSRSAEKRRAGALAFGTLIVGTAAGLVGPLCHDARATMTITPQNYGGNPIINNEAYYASTDTTGAAKIDTGTGAFHDPNPSYPYNVVNITKTQASDQGLSGALSFTVYSSATIDTTKGTPALAITAAGSNNSSPHYIPIGGYQGTACNLTSCLGVSGSANYNDAGTQHYYAAPYSAGATITVQIFPHDICRDLHQVSAGAFGCDTSDFPQISDPGSTPSTTGTPLQLTWEIVYLDGSGAVTGTAVDQVQLNLLFQVTAAPFTCPDLRNNYDPGDGLITLHNTNGFGISNVGTPSTTSAPQTQLYAVGKIVPGTVATNSSLYTANDTAPVLIGFGDGIQVNPPFANTTTGADNFYSVGFMVRDAAGIVNPTPASGGTGGQCLLTPIQTSTINTFLNQSKCFIATAAFRSIAAPPVQMLRQFRDEILLPSELGQRFVHWYYDWSPPAAVWLMRHPHARMPVLEALVPVEVTAWFMLHPAQLTVLIIFLGCGTLLGILFAVVMRAQSRSRKKARG